MEVMETLTTLVITNFGRAPDINQKLAAVRKTHSRTADTQGEYDTFCVLFYFSHIPDHTAP